jgi:MoaA/NifB/PqqE/SkfB family radical SAM enzyme
VKNVGFATSDFGVSGVMNSISNNYPESMHIEWVLNNVCNYKCNYCHDDLNDGSSKHPDLESSIKFFDSIHNVINSNGKLLTLSGGEPTLWPNLTKFLNRLDSSYYTAMTTNGSRSVRWWREFITECKQIHRVIISIHLQYVDIEHIIEVCRVIQDRTSVMILIMYDKNYVDKFNLILEQLKNSDLLVSMMIKPIVHRQNHNEPREYNEKDLELIKNFSYNRSKHVKIPVASKIMIDGRLHPPSYGNYMIGAQLNRFRGWFCEAGLKRLVIWHDGSVYPANCATARKFPLGNINDMNIKKINGIICEDEYCGCWPDIRIPKKVFHE